MKKEAIDIINARTLLKRKLEEVYNREISTPRDFLWLSSQLEAMGMKLSPTTLKRFWGYIPESATPRKATLDALSQLLGYSCFSHFVASAGSDEEESSAPVLGSSIHPSTEMNVHDRILLTWQPGRQCLIRYLGEGQFVVESSKNTRLMPGNTFNCEMIIEGEPLYLDNLVQSGRKPSGYVCGKRNGVHYSILQ